MAIHKVEVIRDDIDGSPMAETHVLTIDGEAYTLDLSEANYAALREALQPFLSRATKGRRRRKPTDSPLTDRRAIRAWARQNGYEVNSKGNISSELREAYYTALVGEDSEPEA